MQVPFLPGQIVRLQSGGPAMTVAKTTRDDGMIEVEWFAGDEIRRDAFLPASLVQHACPGVAIRDRVLVRDVAGEPFDRLRWAGL